jgi:nitroreductase
MELSECIQTRKSCRSFLPKTIDKGILEKVFKAANRSPSYMNSQPWELFVMAGDKKAAPHPGLSFRQRVAESLGATGEGNQTRAIQGCRNRPQG